MAYRACGNLWTCGLWLVVRRRRPTAEAEEPGGKQRTKRERRQCLVDSTHWQCLVEQQGLIWRDTQAAPRPPARPPACAAACKSLSEAHSRPRAVPGIAVGFTSKAHHLLRVDTVGEERALPHVQDQPTCHLVHAARELPLLVVNFQQTQTPRTKTQTTYKYGSTVISARDTGS